jgi:hypothetical protein
MPTTTTEPFSLTPDREAALWEAVEFLGLDPQASALTLVRGVLSLSMDPHRATAFGAACELRFHIDKGRPVEFLQRPAATGPPLPLFGPDDPLRAGYTGPIAEVFPDAC